MMAFVEGLLIGLATVIFFGAVFFTLFNATLQFGQRAGICATMGVVLGDCTWVTIFLVVDISFITNPLIQFWLALVGGVILVIIGLFYLLKTQKLPSTLILKKQYLSLFIRGFIINFASPISFLYWLGSFTYSKTNYPEKVNIVLFLSAAIFGIFIIDVIKVVLAKQIKKVLSIKILTLISRLCGVILCCFGIRLLWFAFY